MSRAILAAALCPVALAAAGYGFARSMSRYFTNTPEWADRIGMETNEYIDAAIAAGLYGPGPDDPR